ncbi:LysR family transcriptional regulator [Microbacterium sp.]|uniref:LysR family transcriptional regulator n=1 Tax=Microbacterium sp. TaxID=51671 RepID=UPI0037C8E2BD
MALTLTQLRTFAQIARLGSVTAAARSLSVSVPAVSAVVGALRDELGDQLFFRTGSGITLTPGGRVLADHAEEIVGRTQAIRRDVAHAGADDRELRVLATAAFAESAAGRLFDAFARWVPSDSVAVIVEAADDIATLLRERAYDIALGARPALAASPGFDVVPFFKYRRIMVAAPDHPLARSGEELTLRQLRSTPWFCGPGGFEHLTEEGRWFGRITELPTVIELTSETDAVSAVAGGEGIMLAYEHIVAPRLRERGSDSADLVRLPVEGTPLSGLWSATTLDGGRAPASARLLQRFVTTARATTAMVSASGSRGLSRRGNKFHVALWS